MTSVPAATVVRYLVSLDTAGDVGWECILSEHAFIRKVLTSCRQQYAGAGSSAGGTAVDAQVWRGAGGGRVKGRREGEVGEGWCKLVFR